MSLANNTVQFGKDWEKPIDFMRLRNERLQKTRDAMVKHGLQALVLFRPENFRYVLGIKGEYFTLSEFLRYSVIPVKGEPWHWELGGDYGRVKENMIPFMPGRVQVSTPLSPTFDGSASEKLQEGAMKTWTNNIKKVLRDNGLNTHGKIGVDALAMPLIAALQDANIDFVDAKLAIAEAKSIKTQDELQLLRLACNIADAGFYTIKQMIRPGIRECEVWAEVVKNTLVLGAENTVGIFTSGGRTNPYYRTEGSERILCYGDLVVSDIVTCYMGYHTCFVRTFVVGGKPTAEQKALYQECYESLNRPIKLCKAGVMTDKIAAAMPEQTYENWSLQIAHGVGTTLHELPHILSMYTKDHPMPLQINQVLALEVYAGRPGGTQGVRLEEQFAITNDGYEMMSRYPFEQEFFD